MRIFLGNPQTPPTDYYFIFLLHRPVTFKWNEFLLQNAAALFINKRGNSPSQAEARGSLREDPEIM